MARTATPTPPEAKEKLRELSRTTRKLMAADKRADVLREERNQLIYESVKLGATEQTAGETGGVTASYAHRVVVSRGDPPSGWDQEETVKGKPERLKGPPA